MEEDGEYLLVCEVDAVPDDVTFTWKFNNETLTERIRTEGTVSTLTVRPGDRDFGTYSCLVNNTVGAGNPCQIDVAGEHVRRASRRRAVQEMGHRVIHKRRN